MMERDIVWMVYRNTSMGLPIIRSIWRTVEEAIMEARRLDAEAKGTLMEGEWFWRGVEIGEPIR